VTSPLQHRGDVGWVAFSPDGAKVAAGGSAGTVRIWDIATGALAGVELRQGSWISSGHFSPDGQILVTSCGDGSVRAWNLAGSEPRLRFLPEAGALYFSPDGRRIATAQWHSRSGQARIWDVRTGRALTPILPYDGPLNRAA